MKYLILGLFLSLFSLDGFAQPKSDDIFFEKVNSFLLKNVESGRINYNSLQFNDQGLSEIIDMIGKMNLSNKSDDWRLAFYINTYNLLVIHQVIKYYPIKSPKDVAEFFDTNMFLVAGDSLTLDSIEHKRIVAYYKDPRIHFALGCAAKSCPFLYDNAYTPEHIQEQLKFRSEIIIDRPNYVEVNERKKTVQMNKIFYWYRDQFEENAGSLIDFVNQYRFYKVPKDYKIEFMEYNWALNKKE